jgi:glycerophosphoryl diester phosphodiesterase
VAVELDVHRIQQANGEPTLCVIHDKLLQRTTSARGPVSKLTVDALHAIDAGDGARIPLLIEVFALLTRHCQSSGGRVGLNIELKGACTAELVAAFIKNHRNDAIEILVSSFDHAQLLEFRSFDTHTPVALLYQRWSSRWLEIARRLDARAVNLAAEIATRRRVQDIRDEGYAVYVYTVNRLLRAQRLFDRGCAGVFTDRPDLLLPHWSQVQPTSATAPDR